jgi:hypothetical protein
LRSAGIWRSVDVEAVTVPVSQPGPTVFAGTRVA